MLLEATNRDQTLSRCVHITDSLVVCVTGYEHQFANRSCTISCTLYIYIRKTLAFSRSKKTYPRGAIEPRFDRVSNFFSRFALDYYSRRFLILNERRMKDVVKKNCVDCRLQGNCVRVRDFRSRGGAQRGPGVQHGTVALLRMRPVELQG